MEAYEVVRVFVNKTVVPTGTSLEDRNYSTPLNKKPMVKTAEPAHAHKPTNTATEKIKLRTPLTSINGLTLDRWNS